MRHKREQEASALQLLKDPQVAILSGSAGIGLVTAALLAERDAEVTIGGRDEDRLARAAALAPCATTIRVDGADAGSLYELYR